MKQPLFKVELIKGAPADISRLLDPPNIETFQIPQTMEAVIEMDITPEFINALINAGLLERLPTKQPDGAVSDELVTVDPEWPNVIG